MYFLRILQICDDNNNDLCIYTVIITIQHIILNYMQGRPQDLYRNLHGPDKQMCFVGTLNIS